MHACCRLTPREDEYDTVLGYQMTCLLPHHRRQNCNKSVSVSVAGSPELAARMLKQWILLGRTTQSKEGHKLRWAEVVAMRHADQLPSTAALDSSLAALPEHNPDGSIPNESGHRQGNEIVRAAGQEHIPTNVASQGLPSSGADGAGRREANMAAFQAPGAAPQGHGQAHAVTEATRASGAAAIIEVCRGAEDAAEALESDPAVQSPTEVCLTMLLVSVTCS